MVDIAGCTSYVLEIRYQENVTVAQTIKVEFLPDGDVSADMHGFTLMITNKVVSRSSEGKRQFDLFGIEFL